MDSILLMIAAVILFWIASPYALKSKIEDKDGTAFIWMVVAFGSLVVFAWNALKVFLALLSFVLSIALTILAVIVLATVTIYVCLLIKNKFSKKNENKIE